MFMGTEISKLESRLTHESREVVRRYIYNCNESLFATILLGAFDQYAGLPLNNAFYLHELTELEKFREEGHEFVDVEATPEFRQRRERLYDSNRLPHLIASKLHCEYLRLKAKDAGYNLSFGAIVEYDPLSSRQDKDDLFSRDSSLRVVEEEKDKAEEFFLSLAKAERDLFYQPFSLGNSEKYRDLIFQTLFNTIT
jgi:hypothetical protein